jgi:histidinol-phosphate/aromatic aminotransferase/cobyric acid decarboxylase-like protein
MDITELIKNNNENEIHNKLIYKLMLYATVNNYQILLTNNIDSSINTTLKTFTNKDSNIIIFGKSNIQYNKLSELITNNVYNVYCIIEFDNLINIKKINKNGSKTTCFLFNPNGQTGQEWYKKGLHTLFKKYKNILFIVDETFIDFSLLSKYYKNKNKCIYSCVDCINKYDNVIVIRSFLNAFGLAGLQMNYIISNVQNINFLSSVGIKPVLKFAKATAINLLENLKFYTTQINNILYYKNDIVYLCIANNIKFIDTKCNFIFLSVGEYNEQLAYMFLKNNIHIDYILYYDVNNNYNNYIKINIYSNNIKTIIFVLNKFINRNVFIQYQ